MSLRRRTREYPAGRPLSGANPEVPSLNKSPQLLNSLLQVLGGKLPVPGGEKPRIRALLDRDKIHILEFARVRAGADLSKNLAQNLFERAGMVGRELIRAQGPNQDSFNFVAAQHQPRRDLWKVLFLQRNLELARDHQEQAAHLFGIIGRKERDVDIQASLALEIHFEKIRPGSSEHPDDAPAIARVGHLLGEHGIDAPREAAIAFSTLALAGSLVRFVDEDHDLSQRPEDGENLFEI